jgi:protein-tyrosine-phosphatase/N-acetylglutamate synthase-like GNAT family acetyltransferase
MKTYIFACVHNAGRSQMAAAWFNQMANPGRARAVSAGTQPGTRVHPEVLQAMQESGIDLSDARPRLLTDELARGATMLITMGCGEACPVIPGLRRDDWPLEDPKGKPVERVREIRDDVRQRIAELVRREGVEWRMDAGKVVAYEPARRSARPAVLELLRSCALPVDDVASDLDHFFVAMADDLLVGTVGIEILGDNASIALFRSLAVAPQWRGRGVARRLYDEARQEARRLGAHELFLLTTTAEAVFTHWGFVRIPREAAPAAVQATPEYHTLCPGSAVVMRQDLRSTG